MVVEIAPVQNEKYKTQSRVYINIVTNKVDTKYDEEGTLVSYTTVDVPMIITQCISLIDDQRNTMITHLKGFNKVTHNVVDGTISREDENTSFVYNEEELTNALAASLNKKL
jgi:hypothetical protein